MSIRTNIFSLTKLFEDGHVMEISLEFERRAKAYNELLAENERLRKAGYAMLGTYIHACAKGLVDQDTAHRVVSDWAKPKEGGAK